MNFISKLQNTYKYVVNNSKNVKINYEEIDKLINIIDKNSITYWLYSNPYNILNMDTEDIINYLLIYHTIGDYCFWGEPKWTITTEEGNLDGSYAMLYLTIKYYKDYKTINLNKSEFKELLKGNIEIPLLEDRYNNLCMMNDFLNGESFYEKIKDKTKDKDLIKYIIENLKYFEDKTYYKGHEVLFYKRAQLLTSDILHILELKDNKKVDYSNLIGCADYKIPQVMYCYGLLNYTKELEEKINKKIQIEKDSEEEIEIRAADLEVIDYIYNKLEGKYAKIDINDYIWLLGQDKNKMNKNYHRTLTNNY